MTTSFNALHKAVKETPLYEVAEVADVALLDAAYTEVFLPLLTQGPRAFYCPKIKMLVVANTVGAYGITAKKEFWSINVDPVKAEQLEFQRTLTAPFDVLEELTTGRNKQMVDSEPEPYKASHLEMAMIAMRSAHTQLELALMEEFRQKLKVQIDTLSSSDLPQLQHEIHDLQTKIARVKQLREEAEQFRGAPAMTSFGLNPPAKTLVQLAAEVTQMVGTTPFSIQRATHDNLMHAYTHASNVIRDHHPRLYGLVPTRPNTTVDEVRAFVTRVMTNQLY